MKFLRGFFGAIFVAIFILAGTVGSFWLSFYLAPKLFPNDPSGFFYILGGLLIIIFAFCAALQKSK
jgi:hypothetical protein